MKPIVSVLPWFRMSLAAAVLALALAVVPGARAQVWNEVGDAGDLVGSAQGTVGAGALTTLNGNLSSPADVDLYCIQVDIFPRIIVPIVSLQCFAQQGPNVWLFDANGIGIATNATCSGGGKTFGSTTIPGQGTYYVAVSYSGVDPFSAPGAIWLPAIGGERAPDGPGAAGPLTGWAGIPVVQGPNPYQVTLSYVGYCDSATPAARPSWGSLKIHYTD